MKENTISCFRFSVVLKCSHCNDEKIREFVAKPPLSKRKKMQTYKPGSVSNLTLKPYHLSKRSVAETLYLPTLLHRAGTLKHRFT